MAVHVQNFLWLFMLAAMILQKPELLRGARRLPQVVRPLIFLLRSLSRAGVCVCVCNLVGLGSSF